jgi:hypothetical protein
VLVKARMQCGARWQDVGILNYSAHGLGLSCDQPPQRGTYIEIRRGPFVMVARVAWTKGHRFGARTQDPIAPIAIIGTLPPKSSAKTGPSVIERRSSPRRRENQISARSRERGRAIEFAGVILAIGAGAALVAETAYAQLTSPLEKVRSALSTSTKAESGGG